MNMNEKIKEILKTMMESGEFEKLINDNSFTKQERKEAKIYYEDLKECKDINELPILPLIMAMPRIVMLDVFGYLLGYKVVEK